MIKVIHAIDRVIGTDRDAVSTRKLAGSPGIEHAPVAVEDDDRTSSPVEDIDPILAVNGDCRNFNPLKFCRTLLPVIVRTVSEPSKAIRGYPLLITWRRIVGFLFFNRHKTEFPFCTIGT